MRSGRRKEGRYRKPEFSTKWEISFKMLWGPMPEENPFPQVSKGLCVEMVISVTYHEDLFFT